MTGMPGGSITWPRGCGGAGYTHLWVRDLPALQWDHGIQGALEHRGDQWSLGAPGGPGGQLVRADQWIPVLKASSGEQLTVQFVLLGNKDASSHSKRIIKGFHVKHQVYTAFQRKFCLSTEAGLNCSGLRGKCGQIPSTANE